MFKDMLRELRTEKGYSMEDLVTEFNSRFDAKMNKSTLSRYENGLQEPMYSTVSNLAKLFGVSVDYLIDDPEYQFDNPQIPGIMPPPKTYRVPRLGTIACGEPILAEENVEGYDEVPESIHCNFTLKCKGDSMTGARINDGDIVYIRLQEDVENGEIAAVLIDEATEISEATLKRVYKYPEQLVLQAENPKYPPFVFAGEDMNKVRIVGKAVGFTSVI